MKITKNKIKKENFLNLLGLLLTVILTISCSTGGDDSNTPTPNTYPREVNITYKMTGTGGPVTSGSYVNNIGGSTTFQEVPLPYVKTVRRIVNKLDDIGISFIHNNSGNGNTPFTIKLEIIVDGILVKTETYSGTSGVIGSIVYLFP